MDVIIGAGGTIAPTIVTGIETRRPSAVVVHRIIGRANPALTYGPVNLRAGTLSAFFDDEFAATSAFDALSVPGPFVFTSDDRPTLGLRFVVVGDVTKTLDDESRNGWAVSAEYQEVAG